MSALLKPTMLSLASAVMLMLTGLAPASADDIFVRELEVFCVSETGVRTGVAASQDGATLAYVQSNGQPERMVRTVHNRSMVSSWHRSLDQAGFDDTPTSDSAAPYCGIDRTSVLASHSVRWPMHEPPRHLQPIFAAIMQLHVEW
jgi:hypothetical protein